MVGEPFRERGSGGGYVFGSGSESPPPSVPTFDFGVALWPTDHWGVAVRYVRGPGQDLYREPIVSGDRTFFGYEDLSYWTVGANYRKFISNLNELNIGFGLMLRGKYRDIQFLERPGQGPVRLDAVQRFGGLFLESLIGRRITKWLTIKSGVTYDFNLDTNSFQPLALAVFTF